MPLSQKSGTTAATTNSNYRSSTQRRLPPLKQQLLPQHHQQQQLQPNQPTPSGGYPTHSGTTSSGAHTFLHKNDRNNNTNSSNGSSILTFRPGNQVSHNVKINNISGYSISNGTAAGSGGYLGFTSTPASSTSPRTSHSPAPGRRGRRTSPRMRYSPNYYQQRIPVTRSTPQHFSWDPSLSDLTPDSVSQYLRQNPDVLDHHINTHVPSERIERWLQRKTTSLHSRYSSGRASYTRSNGDYSDKHLTLTRWKSKIQASKTNVLEKLSKDIHQTHGKVLVLLELADCVAAALSADVYTLYSCDMEKQELTHISKNEVGEVVYGVRERVGVGTSVAAAVAYFKEPKRLKDLLAEKRDGLSVSNSNSHSVLSLPILDDGDDTCFGVVEFYRHEKQSQFTDEEEEIASLLLVMGTTALVKAETHSMMMRQRALSDFLLEVTKSVFQDIVSMDVVIMKIMNFAQRLVNADRASLFLMDYEKRELFARIFDIGVTGDDPVLDMKKYESEQQEIRFSMDKGVAGYVATTGKVLNIKDAYKDKRFNPEVDIRTGYKTKTILCMPIFIRGVVIGVVQMVNKLEGTFTKADEEAFETFAIYCGLALHHAKLYEKIRRSEQKYKVALDVLSYHSQATPEELKAIKSQPVPTFIPNITKYNFSPWAVPEDDKPRFCLYMFQTLFSNIKYDWDDLMRFTLTVRKNYRNVPYHNWNHAFSVAHSMFTVIQTAEHNLTPVEAVSLFVACLCHDLDHRGKTNQFMVQSASPLAAIYTTSTMEHHHFNQTVTILQNEGHNIFKYLNSEEYKKVLSDIKQSILATDLALFFKNKAILKEILTSGNFNWDTIHHRNIVNAVTMTACDLCAMYKPWDVQQKLVYIIMEEFWQQGDEEKRRGLKPMEMMDRDKKDDLPNLEMGFIQSICIPCYELMYEVMPDTKPMLEGAKSNLKRWRELSEQLKGNKGTSVDKPAHDVEAE